MRRGVKRRFDRWWIIPPVLLALVSTLHPLRVHFTDLDRWEGGGFGMYSSVDQARLRPLRLIVHTYLGDLPADGIKWKHNRERLVTLPSTSLLVDELDAHTDREWVYVRVDNNESPAGEGKGGFARTIGSFNPRVVAAESPEGMEPFIEAEGLQLNVHRLVHEGDGLIAVKLIKSVSD